MANLMLDETETFFNIVASDRSVIKVFTDDPIWMARLDKISTAIETKTSGKEYVLRADQLVIRKGKREVSEAQASQFAERMRQKRVALSSIGDANEDLEEIDSIYD